MQEKIDCGCHIPYPISGVLNAHSRCSLEWMDSERKNDFVAFVKEMHNNEILE